MDNNWDDNHTDQNGIFNNNGKSSPVIIHAECRVKYRSSDGSDDALEYYDCIKGLGCGVPFRVTIHNYESDALGFDPTIKSEQNYFCYIHLSTLMNFPWGMEIKFRDDDGVVFDAGDIVRLLQERTADVMKKWEKDTEEFKKRQDAVVSRIKIIRPSKIDDDVMVI